LTPVAVYKAACLKCHDSDGRGEISRDVFPKVPDFTDSKWHGARTDLELSRSILEGKGKTMPPMRGKLGKVDVKRMVRFIRGFRDAKQVVDEEPDDPPAPTPPARSSLEPATTTHASAGVSPSPRRDSGAQAGERLFRRFCVVCHGDDGKGTAMRQDLNTLPDFTLRAWQERRTDFQLFESIRGGKGSAMPPFREKLSPEQIHDLVTFVRSLGPASPQAAKAAPDEFEARFRQLEKEFEGLQSQIRSLSKPPRKL
jgi:mono/diheme cytochrome c family protein